MKEKVWMKVIDNNLMNPSQGNLFDFIYPAAKTWVEIKQYSKQTIQVIKAGKEQALKNKVIMKEHQKRSQQLTGIYKLLCNISYDFFGDAERIFNYFLPIERIIEKEMKNDI